MQKTEQVIVWEMCLTLANNNAQLADDLLRMFIDELPETTKQLENLLEAKDWVSLKNASHKLHGGACYTGVPLVKEAAKNLEHSLASPKESEIREHFDNLINQIQLVRDAYNQGNYRQ